ncbi:hypothetical protein MHB48_04255 [Psychrobacillus sp. FSL H8-0483]|uniref:hypothetical protein n=1 Tax=Psychrobacillus sp. FSL H8-0483 TaxID=2921389 RepID=UPI003159EE3C
MYPNHVDPEEMAMRQDLDVIASLNMIGEGGPVFTNDEDESETETEVKVQIVETDPPENNTH